MERSRKYGPVFRGQRVNKLLTMINKLLPSIMFIISLLSLPGCEELPFSEELDLPINEVEISATGTGPVEVSGDVLNTGGRSITTVYANWFPAGKRAYLEEDRFKIAAEKLRDGRYQAMIDRDVMPNTEYKFRMVYELDGNEKLYSSSRTSTFAVGFNQPYRQDFTFSSSLARTVDNFTVSATEIPLYGGTSRYDFNPLQDIYQERALILSPANDETLFFLRLGSPANYWTTYNEDILFWKQETGGSEIFAWQHTPGSNIVTKLNTISVPVQTEVIGQNILYSTLNGSIQQVTSLSPFTQRTLLNLPYSTEDLIDIYLTSCGDDLYVLVKKNASAIGNGSSELFLFSFNVVTEQWQELSAPPGSSDGALWISAEPGKLVFGGGVNNASLVGNQVQNDVWVLDFTDNEPWKFIGWLPFDQQFSKLRPTFFEGKHYFIGSRNSTNDKATVFTLDLDLLAEF